MRMLLSDWSGVHDSQAEVVLPLRRGHCNISVNGFGWKVNFLHCLVKPLLSKGLITFSLEFVGHCCCK